MGARIDRIEVLPRQYIDSSPWAQDATGFRRDRCSLLFEIMVLSRTRHRALRRPAVIGFETNVIVRCPVQDDPKSP